MLLCSNSSWSYIPTDGQSDISFCVKTPTGVYGQIFITVEHLRSLGALSDEKTGLYNSLVQFAVTLGSKSRRTHNDTLMPHLRHPQPVGPGPCIYIPQEQGGSLIPSGTGFPFVASYDSQGCGGGILTRLFTGHLFCQWNARSLCRGVLAQGKN
jgi:hypothetical protein